MLNYDEGSTGTNLKRIRKEKGYTQRELAYRTGIPESVISAYENGKKNPGLNNVVLLATAMDVTTDELIFGNPADKIVNTTKNDAEVIIRCIYELWKRNMIEKPYGLLSCGELFHIDKRHFCGVRQFDESMIIERFLDNLNDHRANEKTYSKPDEHLAQILESSTNELINTRNNK